MGTGAPGTPGSRGRQGEVGAAGKEGAVGSVGEAGAKGAKGYRGLDGLAGEMGRSRSSLLPRESTPSGSEAPSWPPFPHSNRCGSPSKNTMSPVLLSSTGNASKLALVRETHLIIFLFLEDVCLFRKILLLSILCGPLYPPLLPRHCFLKYLLLVDFIDHDKI